MLAQRGCSFAVGACLWTAEGRRTVTVNSVISDSKPAQRKLSALFHFRVRHPCDAVGAAVKCAFNGTAVNNTLAVTCETCVRCVPHPEPLTVSGHKPEAAVRVRQ